MSGVTTTRKNSIGTQEVMNMFITLIVVMVTWVYTCVQTYHIIYFNYVQVFTCQLYLNQAGKNQLYLSSCCQFWWWSIMEWTGINLEDSED